MGSSWGWLGWSANGVDAGSQRLVEAMRDLAEGCKITIVRPNSVHSVQTL